MTTCPQCRKPLRELTRRCTSCQADLDLLVDYISHLQGGLERAENLTRAGELDTLREYGEATELQRSDRPLKFPQEEWRMVLCAVRLRDDLTRHSTIGIRITPMQAMHRADGPVLK